MNKLLILNIYFVLISNFDIYPLKIYMYNEYYI